MYQRLLAMVQVELAEIKGIINKKVYLLLPILLSFYSYGQRTFEIYQDDNIQAYLNHNERKFNFTTLKDSLPDGIYIFYNIARKDSASKHRCIVLKGEYKEYKKEGVFQANMYIYDKKNKSPQLRYQHISNYKQGKKHGVEKEYNFCPFFQYAQKVMIFYGEYFEGKRHGLFMLYELGSPTKVIIYEYDKIKQEYITTD